MADISFYRAEIDRLAKSRYVDYPARVSIETLALCNAACEFCPYPSLERKGVQMSTELIFKILNDCRDIPSDLPFIVNLSRVNEPFLDRRIFDIADWIDRQLPNAALNFFSNGTPLTTDNLNRLAALPNVNYLNLSVNHHRAQEYERIMKLPYALMTERVAEVHRLKSESKIGFKVYLSRVGDGTADDDGFRTWVTTLFPLFEPLILKRADWNGAVQLQAAPVEDVGCVQWFTLHFLADGRNAFCCIDADGSLGSGDVAEQHALQIYNQPGRRALRQAAVSRLQVDTCQRCPLLS